MIASTMRLLVALAACVVVSASYDCPDSPEKTYFDLSFTWHGVTFEWPCLSTKNIYVSSGRYIGKNSIVTRVQFHHEHAYVALQRFRPGVPTTLGVINLRSRSCSPVIKPFPCWSLQEEGNCNALQNVVDLFIDVNNVLWVLDVGVVNTLDQPIRRCQPKVIGICVKTKKIVKVIDLSHLVCHASRLQYIVADVARDGYTYLYISDAATRNIIVYDVHRCRGFRVMLPKAVIAGCTRRDVLYIALVCRPCGTNILYLTYLSSSTVFSIRTEYLRRGTPNGRLITVGKKPSSIVVLGTDRGTAIFFRFKSERDIYMWDTTRAFKTENFVQVKKGHTCRLSTHVAAGYKRLMWTLESNFHDYIQGTTGCMGPSIKLMPIIKCD